MPNKEEMDIILEMDLKERLLDQIIVWLRAKGLWEDCQKDLVTKIRKKEEKTDG